MVGSAALAPELRGARQPLKLMVSLEMLAFTSERQSYPVPGMERVYGNRGDFIALVANAIGRHVPTKVLPVSNGGGAIPDARLSDHSPFWDAGYNALMVTDTSFMRNPHCHQKSDMVETLDLDFFSAVMEGLGMAFGGLCGCRFKLYFRQLHSASTIRPRAFDIPAMPR